MRTTSIRARFRARWMDSRHGAEREVSRTADGGERRTTCASCGRQVAAGARYCIHCGAEQSLPTPIAAVAAAMARGRPREAANAAHAEPARDVLSDASRADAAATVARTATSDAANSAPPTPPAYDAGPSRTRLAAGLVASLVAVAIALAAFALWRGEHGGVVTPGEVNATTTTTATGVGPAAAPGVAPTESPASAGQAASASTPSLASAPAAANPAPGGAGSATGLPETAATPDAADAPVEIKVLPPHAPAARTPRRSAPEASASTSVSTAPAPEASAAAATPVAQAQSSAPAPAPKRVPDRWQRLDDELSRCTREDFITRVICAQRVRFRYCDGYWGKVAQCPGNPLPDHGQ